MVGIWLISFFILLGLGIPIAFAMGIGSVLAIVTYGASIPLTIIPQKLFGGIDSFTLLALPFYILAGEFMDRGGISQKLISFANSLVQSVRGGLGMGCVLACMIISGVSGSSVADASAIGSIAIPAMKRKGYPPGFAVCLQAGAAAVGPIIPPSIIMIIYCSITNLSVAALFLSGFLPGILVGLCFMAMCYLYSFRKGYEGLIGEGRATFRDILKAFLGALPSLVLPIIIIGGIVSGVFTATEAGAVACLYAFLLGLITKQLSRKDIPELLVNASVTTGVVMLIIAMSSIVGWILARAQISLFLAEKLTAISGNPSFVMAELLAIIILLGLFFDTVAAAIILAPTLQNIAANFGFDPIHFALVMIVAFTIGGITPPVGNILYVCVGIGRIPFEETIRHIGPVIVVLFVTLLLLAYIPEISLILPRMML